MDQQLSATAGSNIQGNSQSLQKASQPANQASTSTNLQTGNSANLLSGQNGLTINGIPLTAGGTTTGTTQPAPTVAAPSHHNFNVSLLTIPAVLLVAAFIMFWLARRSANNTTID